MKTDQKVKVRLKWPHDKQGFVDSKVPRIVVKAGRRSGKTIGAAVKAVRHFLAGGRVLYGAPTQDQVESFWWEVTQALYLPIQEGGFYKNETKHLVELPNSKQRIRAKTCWNADTLRGDWADLLILDEWQLMNEGAWELVGAPMLLDNDGQAVFIFTPPSLHSKSISKARDVRHATKLFKQVESSNDKRWECFTFTSHDNPYISRKALEEIALDMSDLAYRQEIMAEDVDESPGALWTRDLVNSMRVPGDTDLKALSLARIAVGVDPPGGSTECGIVAAGRGADGHLYILEDASLLGSPETWSSKVINTFVDNQADIIVGEKNYGGDMVESTIKQAAKDAGVAIRYKNVTASRGKAIRAEPIAARSERGMIHLVGSFSALEDELCMWIPGETRESPNRLDAFAWACTELMPKVSSWRPAGEQLNEMREEEKKKRAEEMFFPA